MQRTDPTSHRGERVEPERAREMDDERVRAHRTGERGCRGLDERIRRRNDDDVGAPARVGDVDGRRTEPGGHAESAGCIHPAARHPDDVPAA